MKILKKDKLFLIHKKALETPVFRTAFLTLSTFITFINSIFAFCISVDISFTSVYSAFASSFVFSFSSISSFVSHFNKFFYDLFSQNRFSKNTYNIFNTIFRKFSDITDILEMKSFNPETTAAEMIEKHSSKKIAQYRILSQITGGY
ncbi:hypothetical protein MmiHf6_06560 [Methanimicrococcus hongohii]|uniref:Uncharacterized protein n=2 Tax=Methanimicrococcus hongohii TaxID=3028295 RepID=A0AA96UZ46_9EURY|nr:hypothetical protein MmiHf6_06560 [Methanimicrococcus sp. Hf6]